MSPGSTRREFLLSVGCTAAALTTPRTVSGQVSAESWPMLGFDPANTGYNPEATAPREEIGRRFRFEADGQITTAPAIVDGVVYFGTWNGTVYAVETGTGERVWQFGTGGDIRSSPAVVDGTVYVGSADGRLYALNAESGSDEWVYETDGPVRSAPAVSNGTVYFGSLDGFVYAVDATDGEERWAFETGAPVDSSPAVFDTAEGGETTDAPDESPTQDGGEGIYVGSDDGTVHALDGATGDVRWQVNTGARISGGPTAVEDVIYVGNLDGVVLAIDRTSGETRWHFDTGGAVVTTPAVADGRLFVPSRAGAVYALSADSGDEQWVVDLGLPTQPPTVAGDVLLASGESTVVGIEAASGDRLWELDARQPSAAIAIDEQVYVGSDDALFAAGPGSDEPLLGEPVIGTEPSSDPLGGYQFLLWPVTVVAGLATLLGIAYAARRTGVFDWIETRADQVQPYPETKTVPDDSEPGDATGIEGSDGPGEEARGETPAVNPPTPVWELVVDDVIERADETIRTATDDVLVTKYVDSDTLASPVLAYQIESLRDGPALVRLSEPLAETDLEEASRPLGDQWSVGEDSLFFERALEPDEIVRTVVGRPDAEDGGENLSNRPDVTVQEQ